jgi:hypothetical protein
MSAEQAVPRTVQFFARAGVLILCLLLSAAVCGCRLQHLEDSTLALDAATAPVVDQAAAAYRDANALHNLRLDYDAVAEFDAQEPVYNPRNIQVLLSDKDIEARLAVLAAFQVYTKSLCAIVSGTNPPELGEASANLGGKLTTLANTLAPTIEKAAGVAKSDGGSAPGPAISSEAQNAISTGIDALGKFLITRKVKAELPSKIAEMDPHLQALATLLESDIDILQDQGHRDYNRIINLQTLEIRENNKPGDSQRRAEIMKLPEIARKQRRAEEKLTALRAAVVNLAKTHQQLVADAKGTPESLKEKLGDLANAANELGSFFSSLSTQ